MDTVEEEVEEHSTQRKPGAKPNSIPFTVPENRLLSELYLTNKIQYHAKSRVVVGDKNGNGETSQERFACQFAVELTKLGFAHRTSAQVKQRIADIRKLGHKLIIKEREKGVDDGGKKRKKVFVEPWLRNVMDALVEELHETPDTQNRKRGAPSVAGEVTEVDNMSVMAQNVLESHLQTQWEGPKKKKIAKMNGDAASSSSETHDISSPSASEPNHETTFENGEEFEASPSSQIFHDPQERLVKIQEKLLEAQLRVALKQERLLDLKIRKMEFEITLAESAARMRQGTLFSNGTESSGDDEAIERVEWKQQSTGATAEIQENAGDLIQSLLNGVPEEEPGEI